MGASEGRSDRYAGRGLRILAVKQSSPLYGQLQPFLDFIVEAILPAQANELDSPRRILGGLTGDSTNGPISTAQLATAVEKTGSGELTLKVISTKRRSVRSITIRPDGKGGKGTDPMGLILRQESFESACETYCLIQQVKTGSPAMCADLKEKSYLLGCEQIVYQNIGELTQGMNERYYDKGIKDKAIRLAIYDIVEDRVSIKSVDLKKGWGGPGLLGCQFAQGHLNKLPSDIDSYRQQLLEKEKQKRINAETIQRLIRPDGVNMRLITALERFPSKAQTASIVNVPPPRAVTAEGSVDIRRYEDTFSELQSRVEMMEQTLIRMGTELRPKALNE